MSRHKVPPIHPGEILNEEFLVPLGVSQYRLAKETSVPPRRINEIVRGQRSVTADTALRLARYFGTSERFWLNLQARYDLEMEKDRLGERLENEVRVLSPRNIKGAIPDREDLPKRRLQRTNPRPRRSAKPNQSRKENAS